MHLICAGRETGRRVGVCAEVALFLARCHFFINTVNKIQFLLCVCNLEVKLQISLETEKIYNQMVTMLVFVKDQKRQRKLEWDSLRTLYTHLIPNQKKCTFLGSNAT